MSKKKEWEFNPGYYEYNLYYSNDLIYSISDPHEDWMNLRPEEVSFWVESFISCELLETLKNGYGNDKRYPNEANFLLVKKNQKKIADVITKTICNFKGIPVSTTKPLKIKKSK